MSEQVGSRTNWKDITSHSRGDDGLPHWWEVRLASIRVAVGDTQIYYKNGKHWWMLAEPWYRGHQLQATNKESAMEEALALVGKHLRDAVEALEKL